MDENLTPNGNPRRPRKHHAKKKAAPSRFWLGLAVFALVLAAFWAFVMGYVHHCMVIYQAAQPENVVERVVRDLADGTGEVLNVTRFEDPAHCREVYSEQLSDPNLTVRQSASSYDALAPVYEVRVGEETVATVALREKSSQSLMFILTLQEWEVTGVTLGSGTAQPYTFLVPEGYTVTLNGIPLDDRERTGNTHFIDQLRYCANYVAVPQLVEYKVEGMVTDPEIAILDDQGREVADWERDGESNTVQAYFAPSDMPAELSAMALKNAKDYSNFFSRDLPGSQASVAPLRRMFPGDSYYLELAENYRLHDMWMYSGHNAPSFSGERVENYTRYNDALFSCEVYFDKKMILTRTGETRHDVTHTRYYYVNLDGSWRIADMQQILDES